MNKHVKKKGMSQTLALIVAASVLMMTALTVIFLAQGSLGDFGQTSGAQSCVTALDSQCAAGANVIDVPSSCYQSGTVISDAQTQTEGDIPSSPSDDGPTQYECP